MPITVKRDTLDSLKARGLHLLARDLQSRGFVEILTLESNLTASQAYVTARGRIVHVSGSVALVNRFKDKVTP